MKKILVAIDFSDASKHALRYLLMMIEKMEREVNLLHVIPPAPADGFAPYYMDATILEQQQNNALEKLSELEKEMHEITGPSVIIKKHVKVGLPGDTIIKSIKELEANCIIMGNRTGSRFLKTILGSVASNVIQRAEVPILLIPEKYQFKKVKHIAYATNFEKDDISAIEQVLNFSRKQDAQLHCIHIRKSGKMEDVFKLEILKRAYQHEITLQEIAFETLDYPSVMKGLNHFIELKDIDVLVMLTHSRGIFGQIFHSSETRKSAMQAKVPLWIFQMGHIADGSTSRTTNFEVSV